jgi:hypothetical protein
VLFILPHAHPSLEEPTLHCNLDFHSLHEAYITVTIFVLSFSRPKDFLHPSFLRMSSSIIVIPVIVLKTGIYMVFFYKTSVHYYSLIRSSIFLIVVTITYAVGGEAFVRFRRLLSTIWIGTIHARHLH